MDDRADEIARELWPYLTVKLDFDPDHSEQKRQEIAAALRAYADEQFALRWKRLGAAYESKPEAQDT